MRKYGKENRKIDNELEDKKAVQRAFRKAVLVSLFFLFCFGFYKIYDGHSFFDGITMGTFTLAIIIGIMVFIRNNF